MELVLIRHGETKYNRADLFRGRADLDLNDQGLMQARAAAQYLSGLDFEAFYDSPMKRAVQTAAEIAAPHHGEVTPIEYFNDVDYGEWSGKGVDEVSTTWPEEFKLWADDPQKAVFPGGEPVAAVWKRLQEGLDFLYDRHNGRILLVGHRLINRLILCIILGLPISGFWRVDQSNGAINIITRGERGWMLVRMNDISHLEGITSIDQQT